jgi:5,10-methylenetetrahydromethanopterin reductase
MVSGAPTENRPTPQSEELQYRHDLQEHDHPPGGTVRIGVMFDTEKPFEEMIGQVLSLRDAGIQKAWSSQIFAYDALTALAAISREVPDIDLGTAVVPTYPRHPVMLAGQALTVQAASGGRLTLGIGLSHQLVIENVFGQSFEKPARHMREYLSILMPLLEGEQVAFAGETLSAATFGPLQIAAPAPTVLVAALGTTMLGIAGRMASGTITWMTGPATVESHIIPTIRAAAADAGRSEPQVGVGLPVCVTSDTAAARAKAAELFAVYGHLPSYRAMLDREGAGGPADVAIVGTEDEVRAQLRRLADMGTTDFCGAPFGSADEIRASVGALAASVGI